MILRFDLNPVAKGRPRTTFRNGNVRTYTPDKTRVYEDSIRWLVNQYYNALEPFPPHSNVKMEVTFYLRQSMWTPKRIDKPNMKPDIVNLESSLCDAFSKLIYDDDSNITTLNAKKRWSPESQSLSRKSQIKGKAKASDGYIIVELTEDTDL